MELSNQTGSPCEDVDQSTDYGHRRGRTVNRPIRFRDSAYSADVIVTSYLSTSKECRSIGLDKLCQSKLYLFTMSCFKQS